MNSRRPVGETQHPSAELIKATGKCATCHRRETAAVVHQYERSVHARSGINCLECHQAAEGQQTVDHNGFQIVERLTAKNCATCHPTEYDQYARSRHGGPAWAAVAGRDDFSPEQYELVAKYHKAAVDRPASRLAQLEGESAIASGCESCHSVGKPNEDGSFGSCTQCHSRHSASIALARQPATCGQCHMGPDHSQIEIYNESKHGALFNAQRGSMNLHADPKGLTTRDMSVPTCSTCHMSGLEGMKVTHDTTERLSWYLFAPVSTKRAGYARGQDEMQEICLKCHARGTVDQVYKEAEAVVASTNQHVNAVKDLMEELRKEGLLSPAPFDEPIEFLYFDYWHYFGRTAKHGAFMGGADFVQWHGNYELLAKKVQIEHMAQRLRAEAATKGIEDKHDE